MDFTDVLYEAADGIATVTINRPKVLNAFRAETVEELTEAFRRAWGDPTVGVVILTGAGDRAFSSGGDQSVRDAGGSGGHRARSDIGLDVEDLHAVIRDIPKPGSTLPTRGPTWPKRAVADAMVRSQITWSTLPPPIA